MKKMFITSFVMAQDYAAAVDTLKYSDISDFGIAAEIAIRF